MLAMNIRAPFPVALTGGCGGAMGTCFAGAGFASTCFAGICSFASTCRFAGVCLPSTSFAANCFLGRSAAGLCEGEASTSAAERQRRERWKDEKRNSKRRGECLSSERYRNTGEQHRERSTAQGTKNEVSRRCEGRATPAVRSVEQRGATRRRVVAMTAEARPSPPLHPSARSASPH